MNLKETTKIVKVSDKKVTLIKDLTVAEANALRKKALELKITIEKDYLTLGGTLHGILEGGDSRAGQPVWRAWGFKTFDDYCMRELGFRERKGYYLVDIYRQVTEGPLPKKAIEQVGMFRAHKLAQAADKGIITEKNVQVWLDRSENKTAEELALMIKNELEKAKTKEEKAAEKAREKGTAAPEEAKPEEAESVPEEMTIFRVGLYKEQADIWKLAMKKAEKITGSDKDPWKVECIAQHFLSEVCETPDESLRVVCARLEKLYNVKIAAIDEKDGGRCVYGENLVAMAQEEQK